MLVALHTAEFLGFVIDTVEMTVSLPERKIIRVLKQPSPQVHSQVHTVQHEV